MPNLAVPPDQGMQLNIVNVPSAYLSNAGGNVWAPGTDFNNNDKMLVWIYLCNVSGAEVTDVGVGLDIGSGGTLAGSEYWLYNITIPANGYLDWTGPFPMFGDDQIRGTDGGNGGAAVAAHLLVKLVW